MKNRICFILICIGLLLFCNGCSKKQEVSTDTVLSDDELNNKDVEDSDNEIVLSEEELLEQKVNEYLKKMTLEEKAAQLFVILPESLMSGVDSVTAAGEMTKDAIDEIPVGGFIYMSKNLRSEEQVKTMLENVQKYSMERIGLPAFLCVDEEGGTVARIGGSGRFDVPVIEDMSVIGQAKDFDRALEVGEDIGKYLSELGFNVDFAPVADVLSNSGNIVVKRRSFGNDPELVADMSLKVSDGLEKYGVYSTYKHFPGHGSTVGDTHEGYAYTNKTLEELKECELIPFQKGIDNGVSFIMVAHISVPNVVGDNTPASLSKEIIHDLLREEMGYDGIVITDAMNMGAIVQQYSSANAAVKSIQAGVDIILMPANFKSAYNGVIEAVNNGTLSEERIDESVRRILRVKLKMQNDADVLSQDNTLKFVDAWGEWHDMTVNPNVSAHNYNWDYLKNDKAGISYEGDKNYTIRKGIDVSYYQGDIDWKKVKADGYDFAFLRIGYRGYGETGSLNIDSSFYKNIKNAQSAGIDVGVYFFAQAVNEKEAIEEAEFVLEALEGYDLELPVVYDPELIRDDEARTDDVTGEQFTKNTIAFCEKIKSAGYEAMIYSNLVWEAEIFDMEQLTDYPIWYADYEPVPQTPYEFLIWQYTEKGSVNGIDGNVDLNIQFIKK